MTILDFCHLIPLQGTTINPYAQSLLYWSAPTPPSQSDCAFIIYDLGKLKIVNVVVLQEPKHRPNKRNGLRV